MRELKILFSGLANAGKTSILQVLDNRLESLPALMPTQGIEFKDMKVMGLDVKTWDMGGQTSYRNKYLKDVEKYFGGTNLLFYVIDVQSSDTYTEATKYLREITNAFDKIGLKDVHVAILLHKYDPHVQNQAKKADLQKKIDALKLSAELAAGHFSVASYLTSVYEAHTLFQAVSEGILHQTTGAEVLYKKIQEIAAEFQAPAATLVSGAGYLYAHWHSKDVQLMDLARFNRAVLDSAKSLVERSNEEFTLVAQQDTFDVAIAHIPHAGQQAFCCVMVRKGLDANSTRANLLKRRDELQKVLAILQTPAQS